VRVLIVTTWLPTPSSPATGVFIERDIDLLARDHEVHVVHLSSAPAPSAERAWGVETIAMSASNPLSVRSAARRLAPMVERFDLLHTMAASALLPFRRLRSATPWVHTEHLSGILAPEPLPLPVRLALPATLRLMRRPDVVVAVGDRLADAIRRSRAGAVEIVPNAVEHLAQVPERRSLTAGRVSLVAVGGLVPRKGPDIAVETTAELARRGMDVSLRWIGSGPMRDEVEALALRLRISDRIALVGTLPTERVLEELAAADVFLLPTAGETFGVSIAEALASGRPVVVGANGGQAEFVHEPDGVLVDGRTAAAFAGAVERVIDLNATRTAAEIAAAVRARFTDESRRRGYARVYADAVAHARSRAR